MSTADERWQARHDASLRRMRLKERAIDHMGGKCRICGYNTCPAALDFHHIEDMEKEFNISSTMSWAKIEPELAKCVLVCANCHREIHAGWHPEWLPDDART
jgi:predicted HNH restriction endonuclease